MPDGNDKISKAFDMLLARAEKQKAAYDKAAKTKLKFAFNGLVKAYMDAVKKAGSLTSARPATLKLVQAAEKDATVDSVKKAIVALNEHVAAAEKEAGKSGAKELAKFKKGIEGICQALTAQIK